MSRAASRAFRLGVALALCGLLLLSLAQRFAHGDRWWLELARFLPYPLLLAVAALALLVSLRLGWRWVAASAAVLAAVAVLAMGLVWGRPDPPRGGPALRLMTYNIKAYKAAERPGGFAELLREVQAHRPDILLAQDNTNITREEASPIWPGGRAFGFEHVHAVGQYLIASRYPLLECRPVAAMGAVTPYTHARCVVDVDGRRLTLVTTHFGSPRSGLNAARHEGLEGLDDWRRNHEERLAQARALGRDLAGVSRPLVVAGDLNAPEASPVVRALLQTGLRDAFSSAGRGYGFTYGHALRVGLSFLRIDHVLVSPEIGVAEAFAGGGQASEHRPVITDLLLPPR